MTPSDLPPENFHLNIVPPALRAVSVLLSIAVIGVVLFQAVAAAVHFA